MKFSIKRWPILLSGICINLCLGGIYSWSIFANGYMELFGWTMSALTMTFTISSVISPIPIIAGGYLVDKISPGKVVVIGAILYGGGNFLCGTVHSLGALYFFYGVILATGSSFAFICITANTVKFFPEKKGLISGILAACIGASTIIISLIAQALILRFNVLIAFRILGVAFFIILFIGSLFLRPCPKDILEYGQKQAVMLQGSFVEDKNWKQMLSTPRFYAFFAMMILGASIGMMITSQISMMAQVLTGVSASLGATAVSLFAFANMSGRVFWGFLSDKLGKYNVLPFMFLIMAVMLFFLSNTGNGDWLLFLLEIMLVAVCFGGLMGVYPAIVADNFGLKFQGINYSIMFVGFALGGLVGPRTGVIFMDAGQSQYSASFLAAMVMAVMGFFIAICVRKRILK